MRSPLRELRLLFGIGTLLATPAPAQADDARVLVHVESDRAVILETRTDGGWSTVCTSPCDVALLLDGEYRVNGDGVTASRRFRLAGHEGDRITLVVNAGSHATRVVGSLLIPVGITAAALGAILLAVSLIPVLDGGGERSWWVGPSGAALTVAGTGGIVGGALLRAGAKTGVSQDRAPPLPAAEVPAPVSRALVPTVTFAF